MREYVCNLYICIQYKVGLETSLSPAQFVLRSHLCRKTNLPINLKEKGFKGYMGCTLYEVSLFYTWSKVRVKFNPFISIHNPYSLTASTECRRFYWSCGDTSEATLLQFNCSSLLLPLSLCVHLFSWKKFKLFFLCQERQHPISLKLEC